MKKIPLKIYQTWWTKINMPLNMKKNLEDLKNTNPEFEHFLYDDNDCRTFIKENFDEYVLYAFDSLVPGAYKADLWRYCILYKNGGIYLDIKYKCINNFKFIDLIDKEYFVIDRPIHFFDKFGIYNALIVSYQNNPFLLECINEIVKNVITKFYGYSPLYPTGPGLMAKFYRKFYGTTNLKYTGNNIIKDKKKILVIYPYYDKEKFTSPVDYYYYLYDKKKIYNVLPVPKIFYKQYEIDKIESKDDKIEKDNEIKILPKKIKKTLLNCSMNKLGISKYIKL